MKYLERNSAIDNERKDGGVDLDRDYGSLLSFYFCLLLLLVFILSIIS